MPSKELSSGMELASTLNFNFPTSSMMRNKFLLFKPPNLWYFFFGSPKNLIQHAGAEETFDSQKRLWGPFAVGPVGNRLLVLQSSFILCYGVWSADDNLYKTHLNMLDPACLPWEIPLSHPNSYTCLLELSASNSVSIKPFCLLIDVWWLLFSHQQSLIILISYLCLLSMPLDISSLYELL